ASSPCAAIEREVYFVGCPHHREGGPNGRLEQPSSACSFRCPTREVTPSRFGGAGLPVWRRSMPARREQTTDVRHFTIRRGLHSVRGTRSNSVRFTDGRG